MNPDDILIKRAAAGDKIAYEQLIDKYKGYVFAIVLNLIKDRFYAENIAQEAFLQVYISLPKYRFEGFRTWLGRIATRKAIDWKRKHSKALVKEIFMGAGTGLQVKDKNIGPEGELIRQEDAERIRTLCDGLPENYRTVIEKYYFAGKSYRQIAEEENIAVKTVETRLYRARHRLREQWKGGN